MDDFTKEALLFDFHAGEADANGGAARLQHPTGTLRLRA